MFVPKHSSYLTANTRTLVWKLELDEVTKTVSVIEVTERAKPQTTIRGLGDVVAAATAAVGIKPCGGCKKRQELLNDLVPFNTPPEG